MRKTKVLGITSAIDIVGAGIAGEGGILAECSYSSKIAKSEKLIVIIDDVLKNAQISVKDLDAVAVTIGPGSYSGLRGGLATAKGLVKALDIPVIPVSTLHAIAFNLIDIEGMIAVAVNACRDEYNFSLWGSHKGGLKRMTEDITVKMDKIIEILSAVKGRITLAADDALRKRIKSDNILLAEPKNAIPWAVNVARIGMEKLMRKETADPVEVAPLYSHGPNIREFKK